MNLQKKLQENNGNHTSKFRVWKPKMLKEDSAGERKREVREQVGFRCIHSDTLEARSDVNWTKVELKALTFGLTFESGFRLPEFKLHKANRYHDIKGKS